MIERYEKVKVLYEEVINHIREHKESSTAIELAVKKLKEEFIYPPEIYQTFLLERKIIKDLYLLYLKEEGKPLGEVLDTADKIEALNINPPCTANK